MTVAGRPNKRHKGHTQRGEASSPISPEFGIWHLAREAWIVESTTGFDS